MITAQGRKNRLLILIALLVGAEVFAFYSLHTFTAAAHLGMASLAAIAFYIFHSIDPPPVGAEPEHKLALGIAGVAFILHTGGMAQIYMNLHDNWIERVEVNTVHDPLFKHPVGINITVFPRAGDLPFEVSSRAVLVLNHAQYSQNHYQGKQPARQLLPKGAYRFELQHGRYQSLLSKRGYCDSLSGRRPQAEKLTLTVSAPSIPGRSDLFEKNVWKHLQNSTDFRAFVDTQEAIDGQFSEAHLETLHFPLCGKCPCHPEAYPRWEKAQEDKAKRAADIQKRRQQKNDEAPPNAINPQESPRHDAQ